MQFAELSKVRYHNFFFLDTASYKIYVTNKNFCNFDSVHISDNNYKYCLMSTLESKKNAFHVQRN